MPLLGTNRMNDMDTNKGPALDQANRIVRDTTAKLLRLLRNPNRDSGAVYRLQDRLRDMEHRFSGTFMYTLIDLGYKAYISSEIRHLVLDERVHVEIGNTALDSWYTLEVWSFSKPRFRVRIEGGYYDQCLPPLRIYEGGGRYSRQHTRAGGLFG